MHGCTHIVAGIQLIFMLCPLAVPAKLIPDGILDSGGTAAFLLRPFQQKKDEPSLQTHDLIIQMSQNN